MTTAPLVVDAGANVLVAGSAILAPVTEWRCGQAAASRDHPRRAESRGLIGLNREFVMQLGMIGLGRMGANMVRRLVRNRHTCVVYDRNPGAVAELASEGAQGAASPASSSTSSVSLGRSG